MCEQSLRRGMRDTRQANPELIWGTIKIMNTLFSQSDKVPFVELRQKIRILPLLQPARTAALSCVNASAGGMYAGLQG